MSLDEFSSVFRGKLGRKSRLIFHSKNMFEYGFCLLRRECDYLTKDMPSLPHLAINSGQKDTKKTTYKYSYYFNKYKHLSIIFGPSLVAGLCGTLQNDFLTLAAANETKKLSQIIEMLLSENKVKTSMKNYKRIVEKNAEYQRALDSQNKPRMKAKLAKEIALSLPFKTNDFSIVSQTVIAFDVRKHEMLFVFEMDDISVDSRNNRFTLTRGQNLLSRLWKNSSLNLSLFSPGAIARDTGVFEITNAFGMDTLKTRERWLKIQCKRYNKLRIEMREATEDSDSESEDEMSE